MTTARKPRIPATRLAADNATVLDELGLLADLAGTWAGTGFNLIARPDFHDNANLYLQLSQTHETLTIEPIGSPIPNRGFGQDDMEMFGLSYLQKVSDIATGGAMHLEPGLWVTQPPTSYPRRRLCSETTPAQIFATRTASIRATAVHCSSPPPATTSSPTQ